MDVDFSSEPAHQVSVLLAKVDNEHEATDIEGAIFKMQKHVYMLAKGVVNAKENDLTFDAIFTLAGIANMLEQLGYDLGDALCINAEKLAARYGDEFSTAASVARPPFDPGSALVCGNTGMTLDEFQEGAMKTLAAPQAGHIALGLLGEYGEVCDLWKKHVYMGHLLDALKLVTELGDLAYYVSCALGIYNIKLSSIQRELGQ